MFNKLPKIITTFLLILSTTASAGYIDFTGTNEGIADEFIFEQDGIILTISAWTTNVNSNQEVISDWKRLSGLYGVYSALLFQKLETAKLEQMTQQEKARWQQHSEVERGNPVRTFKGEKFVLVKQ